MLKVLFYHLKLMGLKNTIQAIQVYLSDDDYDSLKEFLWDDLNYSVDSVSDN